MYIIHKLASINTVEAIMLGGETLATNFMISVCILFVLN